MDFRLPATGWPGSPSRGPQKKYDWLSARRGPQKMYDPVLGSPVMILRRNPDSQSYFFWGPFFEEPESYFFWGPHPGRSWPGSPKMDRGSGFPRGPFLVVSFFPPCAKLVHTNSTHACGAAQFPILTNVGAKISKVNLQKSRRVSSNFNGARRLGVLGVCGIDSESNSESIPTFSAFNSMFLPTCDHIKLMSQNIGN